MYRTVSTSCARDCQLTTKAYDSVPVLFYATLIEVPMHQVSTMT